MGVLGFAALAFVGLVMPRLARMAAFEKRVFTEYRESRCTILQKRSVSEPVPKGELPRRNSRRPEFDFEYSNGTSRIRASGYDGRSTWHGKPFGVDAVLAEFEVGKSYPCWFDPADETKVVLVRLERHLISEVVLLSVVPFLFGLVEVPLVAILLWLRRRNRQVSGTTLTRSSFAEVFATVFPAFVLFGHVPLESLTGFVDAWILNAYGLFAAQFLLCAIYLPLLLMVALTIRAAWIMRSVSATCDSAQPDPGGTFKVEFASLPDVEEGMVCGQIVTTKTRQGRLGKIKSENRWEALPITWLVAANGPTFSAVGRILALPRLEPGAHIHECRFCISVTLTGRWKWFRVAQRWNLPVRPPSVPTGPGNPASADGGHFAATRPGGQQPDHRPVRS